MRFLDEAKRIAERRWNSTGRGWKVLLGGVIGVGFLLAFAMVVMWFIGRVLKSISVGGTRNLDLYFPRNRRG